MRAQKAKIYHNPKCSKSRSTLQILINRGFDIEVVEYLKTPPDRSELTELLSTLKLGPSGILRSKDGLISELGLQHASEARILDAITEHPNLMERPIVVINEKAVIARPPERVFEIL